MNLYTYAFNNPLSFTDPSGWWPQNDPAENYDEPTGYAPTGGGDVYYVLPNWYNGPADPFAGCAFDWSGHLHDAYINSISYRPPEAGKTFDDYYFLGADGKYHRRDWLANELAHAPTFKGDNALTNALSYYKSTLPKNYFTEYYSDQENWDYSLTAFAGDDDREKVAFGASLDGTIALGPIGFSLEIGFIDNFNRKHFFISLSHAMGLDAGVSYNYITIQDNSSFSPLDYKGWNVSDNFTLGPYTFGRESAFEKTTNPYRTGYKANIHSATYGIPGGYSHLSGFTWLWLNRRNP